MQAVSVAAILWVVILNLLTIMVSWGLAALGGLNSGDWFVSGEVEFLTNILPDSPPENQQDSNFLVRLFRQGGDWAGRVAALPTMLGQMFWLDYPLWNEWPEGGRPIQWLTRMMGLFYVINVVIRVGPTLAAGVGNVLSRVIPGLPGR